MANMDAVKRYADVFGRGLMLNMVPTISAHLILTLLDKWQFDMALIEKYVADDVILWDKMSEKHRAMVKKIGHRAGKLAWLTEDWFLNVVYTKYPREANNLANWPEGLAWLEKQRDALIKIIES